MVVLGGRTHTPKWLWQSLGRLECDSFDTRSFLQVTFSYEVTAYICHVDGDSCAVVIQVGEEELCH